RRDCHRSGSHQEVVRRPRAARQGAELVGVTSRQSAWLRCRISRQPSAPAAPERGPHHRRQGCSSARRCIQQEANGGLTMASERQIAANRRNAHKSTRPRSSARRKRASRTAYRHGLTLSISSTAAFAKQLDKLVHEIAGDTKDEIVLERARAVAQAELELARVRRAKVALIERASAFGELDRPQLTVAQMIRVANASDRGRPFVPKAIDASATMPSQKPERSAEAVRRVLPELRKLDRYEHRAAAQRDKRSLISLAEEKARTIFSCISWQNEANFPKWVQ